MKQQKISIYRSELGVGLSWTSAADRGRDTFLIVGTLHVNRGRNGCGRGRLGGRRWLGGGWLSGSRDWVTTDADLASETVLALLKRTKFN